MIRHRSISRRRHRRDARRRPARSGPGHRRRQHRAATPSARRFTTPPWLPPDGTILGAGGPTTTTSPVTTTSAQIRRSTTQAPTHHGLGLITTTTGPTTTTTTVAAAPPVDYRGADHHTPPRLCTHRRDSDHNIGRVAKPPSWGLVEYVSSRPPLRRSRRPRAPVVATATGSSGHIYLRCMPRRSTAVRRSPTTKPSNGLLNGVSACRTIAGSTGSTPLPDDVPRERLDSTAPATTSGSTPATPSGRARPAPSPPRRFRSMHSPRHVVGRGAYERVRRQFRLQRLRRRCPTAGGRSPTTSSRK